MARAHGVRRRNFRLEAMLGSCVKQRIGISRPKSGQPHCSTSSVNICCRVRPCRGLLVCGFRMDSLAQWVDACREGTADVCFPCPVQSPGRAGSYLRSIRRDSPVIRHTARGVGPSTSRSHRLPRHSPGATAIARCPRCRPLIEAEPRLWRQRHPVLGSALIGQRCINQLTKLLAQTRPVFRPGLHEIDGNQLPLRIDEEQRSPGTGPAELADPTALGAHRFL